MLKNNLCFLWLALVLTSCGYRWGDGDIAGRYKTISIHFAEGDLSGALTQAVVHEIASQTSLVYVNGGADLELVIKLKEIDEENVGFRYDRNKHDKRVDYIIPTETRLQAFAEVTLVDRAEGCALFGPLWLEASYDFDHDYYTSHNAVNIFSLGQLTDYDEAYDAAMKPLYQNLARKIIDYLKV